MNFDVDNLKKSKELAMFLGMFVGDGCLSINHNGEGYRIYPIGFYNTNKEYVKFFQKLFFKLFKLEGSIRCTKRNNKKDLWEFQKYSVKIYKLLNEDFEIFCGKKALNVKIPSFILKGNDSVKKNFFLGLLITDGGIRKDGDITFHSASPNLINDLKKLINDVWGFDKNVKEYVQKGKFKSYQINLKRSESSIILSEMPSWHNLALRGF